MPVNCRTCRRYQVSIVAEHGRNTIYGVHPCVLCAHLKGRKSYYEPVKWQGEFAKEADHQKGLLDL